MAAARRPLMHEEALALLAEDPSARLLAATWTGAVAAWEGAGRREPLGDVWAFVAHVPLDAVYSLGAALLEAGILLEDGGVAERAGAYLVRHAEHAAGMRPPRAPVPTPGAPPPPTPR